MSSMKYRLVLRKRRRRFDVLPKVILKVAEKIPNIVLRSPKYHRSGKSHCLLGGF